ncbi:RCC1 domain-containing protein [Bdellovibrio sp. BCCA]|uniref:RCC1 domain-containing protein n=1 Tax=Bdellovibrio sp. BCCA TaxID=3136281 RepID=UPI0030F1FDE5
MKSIFLIIFLFVSQAFAVNPQFIELRTNKSQYQVGEKVVLMASIKTSPTDPDSEIYMTGTWGGAAIKLTKFADFEAAAVTPAITSAGQTVFHVDAYIQKKQVAKDILSSIAGLDQENNKLSSLLVEETNPAKKINLQQAIDNNNQLKQSLLSQLSSHRTLVETKEINVSATAALARKKIVSSLLLTADHLNNTYSLGQSASVNANIVASALGYDIKEMELLLTSKVDGNLLTSTPNSSSSFLISVPSTKLTLGTHEVKASLTIRNKRDGKSLSDAVSAGFVRKSEMVDAKNKATDPNLIAYYQSEIDDLSMIVTAFSDVLDSLKIFIGETALSISVEQPSIVLSKDNLEIYEGSKSSYNVSLVSQPTSNVTVVATSPTTDITLSSSGGAPWASTATLTFTTSNWNVPQKISVNTVDDHLEDGNAVHLISHNVSGGGIATGQYMPVRVTLLDNGVTPVVWESISVGEKAACGIRGGALYCWGSNTFGRLGLGDLDNRNVPTAVRGMSAGVQSVSVGVGFACAVKAGELYCWGNNNNGQIGQGFTGGVYPIPTKVALNNVLAVNVGFNAACAITNNTLVNPPTKLLFCWGSNNEGQLGVGDKVNRSSPTLVTFTNPKQVSVGHTHSCAINDNGTPYCWGKNTFYTLGNGNTTASLTPIQGTQLGTNVTKIVASMNSTCILNNGAAKCVGLNSSGQLGDPNQVGSASSPVTPIGMGAGVTDIDAYTNSVSAVKNGSAYYWGYVALPSDGVTFNVTTPTLMSGIVGATSIDADHYGHCTVAEGKGYCWGSGTLGTIGDGTWQDSYTPIEVMRPASFLGNEFKY